MKERMSESSGWGVAAGRELAKSLADIQSQRCSELKQKKLINWYKYNWYEKKIDMPLSWDDEESVNIYMYIYIKYFCGNRHSCISAVKFLVEHQKFQLWSFWFLLEETRNTGFWKMWVTCNPSSLFKVRGCVWSVHTAAPVNGWIWVALVQTQLWVWASCQMLQQLVGSSQTAFLMKLSIYKSVLLSWC